MSLREKQSLFLHAWCAFVLHAETMGYAFTFGEAYRTPEQAARNAAAGTGIAPSLHGDRLAIDANVFVQGRYLAGGAGMDAEEAAAWEKLGTLWEQTHALARWGGRFRMRDYNHFSFSHQGRA